MDGLIMSKEAVQSAMREARRIVEESAAKAYGTTGDVPSAISITLDGYERCIRTLLYMEAK